MEVPFSRVILNSLFGLNKTPFLFLFTGSSGLYGNGFCWCCSEHICSKLLLDHGFQYGGGLRHGRGGPVVRNAPYRLTPVALNSSTCDIRVLNYLENLIWGVERGSCFVIFVFVSL